MIQKGIKRRAWQAALWVLAALMIFVLGGCRSEDTAGGKGSEDVQIQAGGESEAPETVNPVGVEEKVSDDAVWEEALQQEENGYSYNNELFEEEAACEECWRISQGYFKDGMAIQTEGLSLTWDDLKQLTDICGHIPCFENQDALDEKYYLGLINLSVSGPLGWAADEIVMVEERKEYSCASCAKISREDMENYVRNLLGTELPIYGPSKQEMLENESNFFYEDGYYYIGLFDWLDIVYDYLGYETTERGTVIVEFVMHEAGAGFSAVLELAPAENENGYIIVSYKWVETQQ